MNMHTQPALTERQRRLLWLADNVEKLHPYHFDMTNWNCCLAGHLARLLEGHDDNRNHHAMSHHAADFLRLTTAEQCKLFMPTVEEVFGDRRPTDGSARISKITREWAARTLRHFAYTGRIDWPATRHELPINTFVTMEGHDYGYVTKPVRGTDASPADHARRVH